MARKNRKRRKRNILNKLALCREMVQKNPQVAIKDVAVACYGINVTRRKYQYASALRSMARQQIEG